MHSKCIDLDKFIGYLNKDISNKDRAYIEDHLSHCDRCLEMVVMTSQLVSETNYSQMKVGLKLKAQEMWKNLKQKIKNTYKWNKDQFPPLWVDPFLQPALVKVSYRSDQKEETLENALIKKVINDLSIEIFFERNENLVTIKIIIIKDNQIAPNINIVIERIGAGYTARQLKEPFAFFEDLPFGKYRIMIEEKGIHKGDYDFEINEKGISEI